MLECNSGENNVLKHSFAEISVLAEKAKLVNVNLGVNDMNVSKKGRIKNTESSRMQTFQNEVFFLLVLILLRKMF